jgi:hypothetical protein
LVLLLSVAIAGTSAWYGHGLHKKVTAAKTKLSSVKTKEAQQKKESQELVALLTEQNEPDTLYAAVSYALLSLQAMQDTHRISLGSITAGKSSGRGKTLADSSEKLGSANLNAIRLLVKGTYKEYEGLTGFIETVRTMPVTITHIKVDRNSFELGLRIYGTVSGGK